MFKLISFLHSIGHYAPALEQSHYMEVSKAEKSLRSLGVSDAI